MRLLLLVVIVLLRLLLLCVLRWHSRCPAPGIGGAVGARSSAAGCHCALIVHPLTSPAPAANQGLALVHFSAQRKRFLRDKGCNL
jgi:hypothetical protein